MFRVMWTSPLLPEKSLLPRQRVIFSLPLFKINASFIRRELRAEVLFKPEQNSRGFEGRMEFAAIQNLKTFGLAGEGSNTKKAQFQNSLEI